MAFYFDESKLQPRTIEIDLSAVTCDSPEVKKRMDRIEDNYDKLGQILGDMELKISANETLIELDEENRQREEEREAKKAARAAARAAKRAASKLPNKPR